MKKLTIKEIVDYYLKENPRIGDYENTEDRKYDRPDENRVVYDAIIKHCKYIDTYDNKYKIYRHFISNTQFTDYFINEIKEEFFILFNYKIFNKFDITGIEEKRIYKKSDYDDLYISNIYLDYYLPKVNAIISDGVFSKSGNHMWETYVIPNALLNNHKVYIINYDFDQREEVTSNNQKFLISKYRDLAIFHRYLILK